MRAARLSVCGGPPWCPPPMVRTARFTETGQVATRSGTSPDQLLDIMYIIGTCRMA
jgi:hypothetical protein